MADQAHDSAVELDVSGAADQLASLLVDDEEDKQEDANHSSQTEGESVEEEPKEGADEESEGEGAEPPAQTYTVRIDGKDAAVTLDELTRGYQRNADYTQKTQQLADQRRQQQAEFDAVKQERARYGTLLQTLEGKLSEASQEPNWDQLAKSDPLAYATQWAQWQQLQQQRAAVQAERQRLGQQQALDEQTRLRERVDVESQRLLDVIPAWKDETKATAERKALVEYGLKSGFSPEELNSVYDHRVVHLLYRAWKYDQALAQQKAAHAKVGAAPQKVLQPGQGKTPRVAAEAKARQRLAQTGSVEDAAALIERYL